MVQWSHADALGSDSLITRFAIVGRIEIYLYTCNKPLNWLPFASWGFLKLLICLLELVFSYLVPEAFIPYFNTITL